MRHCSDDELVLHYYREERARAPHIDACADCARRYAELAALLDSVAAEPVPDRGAQYGLEVWQQIRLRLPERAPWWQFAFPWRLATAGVVAIALLVAGFAAGRFWQTPATSNQAVDVAPAAVDEQARRRVLLLTVAEHLEQSERILTGVVNTPDGVDISTEQQWAGDMVAANRLYRQDAVETNELALADLLEDLERTLLEIVHHPSPAAGGELEELRRRIDSAALLFKVRVLSDELRERELASTYPSTVG